MERDQLDLHDPDPRGSHFPSRPLALLTVLAALAASTALELPVPLLLGLATAAAALLGCLHLVERHEREAQVLRDQLAEARAQEGQLRRHLERQEKLTSLGLLAAGVAHEINNPMSYVMANVSGLLAELGKYPALPLALREYADEVLPATLDGIRRINGIVADLRTFARDDQSPFTSFDLNDEVKAALRIAGGQLGARCEVIVTLGKLPAAFGNARQIGQVLVNLLVNAAQAIPGRGKVAVTTRCDPDELLVEVRDDGAGMTPDVQTRLFQPFFTTKPVGKGTGLGLAVAQGIARRHGGRIAVESAPGHGSVFTIHLPRTRIHREATPLDPARAPAPSNGAPYTALAGTAP